MKTILLKMKTVGYVGITRCAKSLKYLFCAMLLMLFGCADSPEDPRLLAVAEKVSDSPQDMLARLDSMDAGSSRRGYICEMIFGKKLGAKVMDDIIRLL